MGRKRLENPKVQVTVRIEKELRDALDKKQINKTELFISAAKKIIQEKK